ncbi:MAG: hypothetical protein HUJ92_01260 [Bacteroidales bacterium]|nr:hypothetical protein [Bacteroidales bacterium]
MKPTAYIKIITGLVATCLVISCSEVEPGVSKQLAESRASALANVSYDISVSVPDSLYEDVEGVCSVSFELASRMNLPFDFCGPEGSEVEVVANGKHFTAKVLNEHVTIPRKYLHQGTNLVEIPFVSGNRCLNRHKDYLYTLFVPANARTVFPCFDQPDIKAVFSLTLEVPANWRAIGNGKISSINELPSGRKQFTFNKTVPLPTYLFAFVAGVFEQYFGTAFGHDITIYHRHDNEADKKDFDAIVAQSGHSIKWMEDYTGIPYPYEKYDMVVLPGYQFGGMEHAGAIQFNDRTMFPGANPTASQLDSRDNLIAHETAHQWFGDLVTMKWFNDVWTKEIFAGFFAGKIKLDANKEQRMLHDNHRIAYGTDFSEGSHPIQQNLDNLNQAGLLYGNIIYDKAPAVLDKIEDAMGEEALQAALRQYLKKYSYGNAVWDNLIEIMEQNAPDAGMKSFDEAWVKRSSLPIVKTQWKEGYLIVSQQDRLHRGVTWPQKFEVALIYGQSDIRVVKIELQGASTKVAVPDKPQVIIPNSRGMGYAIFEIDEESAQRLLSQGFIIPETDDIRRESVIITLYWNYRLGNISEKQLFDKFAEILVTEKNPLTVSAICSYLSDISLGQPIEKQRDIDRRLLDLSESALSSEARMTLLKALSVSAVDDSVLEKLYAGWENELFKGFSKKDYSRTAMHLSVMMPEKCQQILDIQRSRLTAEDERREFDYVSQGCNPAKSVRDSLFYSLIEPQGRGEEPWALDLLSLLRRKVRQTESIEYIPQGLDALEFIQKTSDIFFPGRWVAALIGSNPAPETSALVREWLAQHPSFSPMLKNKILEVIR